MSDPLAFTVARRLALLEDGVIDEFEADGAAAVKNDLILP